MYSATALTAGSTVQHSTAQYLSYYQGLEIFGGIRSGSQKIFVAFFGFWCGKSWNPESRGITNICLQDLLQARDSSFLILKSSTSTIQCLSTVVYTNSTLNHRRFDPRQGRPRRGRDLRLSYHPRPQLSASSRTETAFGNGVLLWSQAGPNMVE